MLASKFVFLQIFKMLLKLWVHRIDIRKQLWNCINVILSLNHRQNLYKMALHNFIPTWRRSFANCELKTHFSTATSCVGGFRQIRIEFNCFAVLRFGYFTSKMSEIFNFLNQSLATISCRSLPLINHDFFFSILNQHKKVSRNINHTTKAHLCSAKVRKRWNLMSYIRMIIPLCFLSAALERNISAAS